MNNQTTKHERPNALWCPECARFFSRILRRCPRCGLPAKTIRRMGYEAVAADLNADDD